MIQKVPLSASWKINFKWHNTLQSHIRRGCNAFSLFELLVSLTLVALVLMLLIATEMQAAKMLHDQEQQEIFMAEGSSLLQMISHDVSCSSFFLDDFASDLSTPLSSQHLFFLTRNANDDLVAVGYFLDPKKQGDCYRFSATAQETLKAQSKGILANLYACATPGEAHCELIARHLLSWDIHFFSRSNNHLPHEKTIPSPLLLEICTDFGTTTPRYFLSTVIAIPSSSQ